jgi:hypothetical protein
LYGGSPDQYYTRSEVPRVCYLDCGNQAVGNLKQFATYVD